MLLALTIEINICLLGVVLNSYLLYKVAVRPVLWSTTNIFICCLLSLNTLYLLGNLVLTVDKNIGNHNEPLLLALDILYLDIYNSRLCAAQYIMSHVYRSTSINIFLSMVFLRMILIKHGDKIRTESMRSKQHQARLSVIGALFSLFIFSYLIILIFNLVLFPQFPYEFLVVRHCRGLPSSYTNTEWEKIRAGWSIDVVLLLLVLVIIVCCNLRVLFIRRKWHRSRFTQRRQNIATLNQVLVAAYLKLFSALTETFSFLLILNNSSYAVNTYQLLIITSIINCIVVPGFWLYSSGNHLKEITSQQIKTSLPLYSTSPAPRYPLEPRRPNNLEMTFQKKNALTEQVECRFSFFSQRLNSKPRNQDTYIETSLNVCKAQPQIQLQLFGTELALFSSNTPTPTHPHYEISQFDLIT